MASTSQSWPLISGWEQRRPLEAKVSTEIPAQSMGRFVDAVIDCPRPFSEGRGLKGDQIRLQREEVLIKVAQKARQRMEIENQPIHPLPNKFLVPFLEKASLEEIDSVLVDRWADLLAASSMDPVSAHPRFVQILSEITGNDVDLLRAIALNGIHNTSHPEDAFFDCPYLYDPLHKQQVVAKWFLEHSPNVRDIFAYAEDMFSNLGVSLVNVLLHEFKSKDLFGPMLSDFVKNRPPAAKLNVSINLNILSSLEILSKGRLHIANDRFDVDIFYVSMTELGIELLMKCDREVKQKLHSRFPNRPQASLRA